MQEMGKGDGQLLAVRFSGTVSANTNKTVVSQKMMRPFRLYKIIAYFALNTNRTLKLYFYISPDNSEPTSSPLTGSNILGEAGQVDYVVGDNDSKEMNQEFFSKTGNMYLKVFAENTDVFSHTIDVTMFIEVY